MVSGRSLSPSSCQSNEVFADSVAPVHVSPAPAIRVVLEKEVILAIVEDHAIRVVVPSALGREVELSSQGFTIHVLRVFKRYRFG